MFKSTANPNQNVVATAPPAGAMFTNTMAKSIEDTFKAVPTTIQKPKPNPMATNPKVEISDPLKGFMGKPSNEVSEAKATTVEPTDEDKKRRTNLIIIIAIILVVLTIGIIIYKRKKNGK